MKTKILIVTTTSETLTLILKGQPAYLNQSFSVYLATSNRKLFSAIQNTEGILPFHVAMYRGINPLYDIYSIISMIWVLLRIRPHVVHSYTPKAGLIAMISAFLCGIPVRIHTFTGLIFPTATGLKQRLLKCIDKLICILATRIIPEGNGVRNELVLNKITEKKLEVIGNGNIAGIDTAFFSKDNIEVKREANKLKLELNLRNSFIFIYIGRLNKDKGVNELIASFESLNTPNIHLLIVGGLDSSAPISKATIDKINNSQLITWLGFQSDIRPALALSNALILPSYREGFPNVLMQASSMKVPSISTDVSGANEIIEDGETGFIVPTKDIDALSKKMNHLLSINNSELERLGENARKRVCELFERDCYLNKLREFYISELIHKKII